MPEQTAFYLQNVKPLEESLLRHDLAVLFDGGLYISETELLQGLDLPDFGDGGLVLSPVDVGRLFMAPRDSLVSINQLAERDDGSPAGFNVSSDNPFVQEGEPVVIIAYQTEDGTAVRLDNLHIKRMFLDSDAPARFCTVAFGLMAVTAYRLGFKEITLFAAGRGPVAPEDPDEMVGYLVWPKFGFDAEINRVDIQGMRDLAACHSVQDIRESHADWWDAHGSEREMSFDLSPNSRSWHILLNYLQEALEGDQ